MESDLNSIIRKTTLTVIAAYVAIFSIRASAYNYSGIPWLTIKTEHFRIHYYDDVAWTASKVAKVAEEVWTDLEKRYGVMAGSKIDIVVRDDEDTANGRSTFNINTVTIWATNSTMPLRGRHDWIRGTLVHELAHIFSLKAANKGWGMLELLRLGLLRDPNTRDNTDLGISLPIPSNTAARWWAEGVAQFETSSFGYDRWDTSQDMVLRMAAIEGRLLNFNQMQNITVREELEPELLYNQGFSFVSWLISKYGEGLNADLAGTESGGIHLDFNRVIKKVTGKDSKSLYEEWERETKDGYLKKSSDISKNLAQGDRVTLLNTHQTKKAAKGKKPYYADGIYNFYPRFSPGGRWFSYISKDKLILRSLSEKFKLNEMDLEEMDDRPAPLVLKFDAKYYTFSPDENRLIVSKRKENVLGGYPYFDLYLIDITRVNEVRSDYLKKFANIAGSALSAYEKKKKLKEAKGELTENLRSINLEPERITHALRATHPAWSPDGKRIAFVKNEDGHRSLGIITDTFSEISYPLESHDMTQVLDPVWSHDGGKLFFGISRGEDNNIWEISPDGSNLTQLTFGPSDTRDPEVESGNPDSLYYSSDRTGIFQIYRTNLKTGTTERITNVLGGSFQPSVSESGILYSNFFSSGFKIYSISKGSESFKSENCQIAQSSVAPATASESYPQLNGERYTLMPRPLRLFPTFVFEDGKPKMGAAFQISDVLEKHNLQTAFLIGRDMDWSFYYFNNSLIPTLFLNYSGYIRNSTLALFNDNDSLQDDPVANIRYYINFLKAGLRLNLEDPDYSGIKHEIMLYYNGRWVNGKMGIPIPLFASKPDFIGTDFKLIENHGLVLEWNFSDLPDSIPKDFDINPRDVTEFNLSFAKTFTKLDDNIFTVPPEGDLSYSFETLKLKFSRYFSVPWFDRHALGISFFAGFTSREVDFYDKFFAGGRLGFRAFGDISPDIDSFPGYEDYSIYGDFMFYTNLTYRFPLLVGADKKFSVFYLDSIYAALFCDFGNAWDFEKLKNTNEGIDGTMFLEDVGIEIRMKGFLFDDSNSWNSILKIAYGFQDRRKYASPYALLNNVSDKDFSSTDSPIRIYLGIGTDF